MGFEFIQTMGYTWGYVFIVVIAGLALFVGATKKKNAEKKKLAEAKVKTQQTNEPELEKVEKPKVEETKTTEPTEQESKDE